MLSIFSGIKSLFGFGTKGTNTNSILTFEKVANIFGTHCAESARMLNALSVWNTTFQVSKTQMMKIICHEAAKLTLTDLDISLNAQSPASGTIQAALFDLKNKLTRVLEVGIALGGLVIKPTLNGFDLIAPTNFIPTEFNSNGDLCGAIFITTLYKGGHIYKRFEYHRFVNNVYMIDNRAYMAKNEYELGSPCALKGIPEWADISEHTEIDNLTKPLFSYFRMPGYNNIDETSYSGISLCSAAMEYLSAYDNAFDGFKADLETTRKIIFVNNAALINVDKVNSRQGNFTKNPLPNLIVGLSNTDQIKEFNPSCNVDEFKTALQMLLNMIATSCGFTSGYFSFDNARKAVTATQIESEDQITVATVIAIRNNLKDAVISAINSYIDLLALYNIATLDDVNVTFYTRDISVTPEADRAHTLELVKLGYYPLELYLKEYEGITEGDLDKYKIGLDSSQNKTANSESQLE